MEVAKKPDVKEALWEKEYFPGLLLFAAAIFALVVMNSPLHDGFIQLREMKIGFGSLKLSIDHWIQDGLMTLFFLFVSLELKRELMDGVLSNPKHAALPVAASLGGTIVPALIYLAFNHEGDYWHGWAIPSATDIAFAMGVLSLFGNRVPNLLKAFLLALAIVDDLAAVLIIAFGYTVEIASGYLGIAMGIFTIMMICNRLGIRKLEVYWVLGFVLWLAMLFSGIHPTLAGVLTAIAVPFIKSKKKKLNDEEPLIVAEHALRPAVQYFIMPLYAVVAAGFTFVNFGPEVVMHPITLGIFAGLLIGKPAGILLFAWLFRVFTGSNLQIPWMKLTGAACLAGIGFSMSLFIGNLAFTGEAGMEYVRVGVFGGSILSGLVGAVILDKALQKRGHLQKTSAAAPFLTRD